MKNQLKLTSLILTAALAALPALQAQPAEGQAPARERGPGGPGGRGGPNLQMIAEELGLSADQKAKLAPVLKHQAEQMQAIRQDESLSREQRMEKGRAIREAGRKDIETVLTPEQAKKFAEMRARGQRGDGERPRKDGKQGDK
jgi:periplasmic protein CpxP/Spy